MFRVLSSEESNTVKKWRAPSLGDSVTEPNKRSTTTDIASLQQVLHDSQKNGLASNEAFNTVDVIDDQVSAEEGEENSDRGNHASMALSGPSAEMLQQSYDEGVTAGIQLGQAQTRSDLSDPLLRLLSSLGSQKNQIDSNIEGELVSLAKAIAALLIRREIESDDAVIVDIVHRALESLPMSSQVPTVILNPLDVTVIQNLQTTPLQVTLVSNPDMERGDCRIECGASTLDAGIDALVKSIASSDTRHSPRHAEVEQAKPNISGMTNEES